MDRRALTLTVAAALTALVCGEARAQTTDTTITRTYQLTSKSRFEQGCFGACLCPVAISDAVVGTFRLTPAGSDPLFTVYNVTDVNWLVRLNGADKRVTGSGTYRIGGEFALTQELQLDLKVGDAGVQRFDSGLVPGGSEFPAIDLTISVNGMVCFDTVFVVSAQPVPAGQTVPWSLVGSSYLEGCFGPCECAVSSRPTTGRFGLLNLGEVGGVTAFAVLDVNWRILWSAASIPTDGAAVTGFGIYEVSAPPGSQRLALDLVVGGKGPQRFDSGWVAGGTNPRRIDIEAAANGFACLDQVFDLHARAIRPVTTLSTLRRPAGERKPRHLVSPLDPQ